MPDTVALTGLQLSILQVLWDRGEATTYDVWVELRERRALALTTVATLLSRLERRKVLTHRRQGRQYVYRPTVTQQEVRRSKVRELTESLFDGDPSALVSHLVQASAVDAADLARIRELIARAENGEDGG